MNWSRLAPWLIRFRTALLTLGGFSSLAVCAFMLNLIAGFGVLGLLLLVLEFLLRPDEGVRRA